MSAGYNSSEVCRLCTTGGGLRMHIFDKEGEQRQLLFKIKSCLPIMISKEDTLPKKICYRCAYKLDMFYEFRLSCLNSENMLKNVTEKQLPVENGQRDEIKVMTRVDPTPDGRTVQLALLVRDRHAKWYLSFLDPGRLVSDGPRGSAAMFKILGHLHHHLGEGTLEVVD